MNDVLADGFGYEGEIDGFVWWAFQELGRAKQVERDLVTLRCIGGEVVLADVFSARDAAARLYALACEGGFAHVMAVFGSYYDSYCRALLSFWREVS